MRFPVIFKFSIFIASVVFTVLLVFILLASHFTEIRFEDNYFQLISIFTLLIVFSILLSLIASIPLINALNALANATNEFKKGNYGTRVEKISGDEIGDLAKSFNEMMAVIETSIANLNEQQQAFEIVINQTVISEEKSRSFLDSAHDAIIHIFEDGKISYANFKFLRISGILNITDNYNFFDFVSSNYSENLKLYIKDIEKGKLLNEPIHFVFLSADSKNYDVEMTMNILQEERQNIYQIVLRDITERIKLQEQLIQSRKLESIGRLAGGISHDFNNLLAIIIPNAEMIKLNSKEDKTISNATQIISASVRASNVIKQLLSFSRQHINTMKPGNLIPLITDTAVLLEKLLTDKIKIRVDLQSDYDLIEMDETQIQQVLINLAVNARDAMPNGGELSFKTSLLKSNSELFRPDYIELIVSDTGSGIAEENLQKIFEPFFTTKKIGEGTGLGLAGAYGIIQHHNGKISVRSEINIGTSFSISLPLYWV